LPVFKRWLLLLLFNGRLLAHCVVAVCCGVRAGWTREHDGRVV
jgi:hypothetical protein